jgi:nuclear transport factor 2 (NTF2) superfamily protein
MRHLRISFRQRKMLITPWTWIVSWHSSRPTSSYMNGKLVGKGIDDVRRWHEKLFAAVRDYRLTKTLRAASGDVITVEFADTWVNPKNDEPMQGFGGEFWTMDGDRLAEWHLYWRGYPRTEGAEG